MNTLTNKLAVITGGNSGIGYATAQEFIASGAQVIITGRNKQAVNEAAATLSNHTIGVVSDAAVISDIKQITETVKSLNKPLDILFINAGVAAFSPVEQITEEHFDYITDINYKGALFTLQQCIPLLSDHASVIFLTSVNATSGMANTAVYAASKAALHAVVKVAANELSSRGIRVNAVSPGPINTPLFGKVGLDEAAIQGFAHAMQNSIPLKRFGGANEVSKLVTFLASDDAKFITGAEFVIDGGVNVNRIL
ncbi:MAG: SDR family oxidoreductase [Bacteroidia bacterium]|jgi:NAD(P)-dependent dehydrogenase (short-subunit alcohol dehydrogenase family)|nr:SDR family oxidoreductase [Bacteroidia bacterium]